VGLLLLLKRRRKEGITCNFGCRLPSGVHSAGLLLWNGMAGAGRLETCPGENVNSCVSERGGVSYQETTQCSRLDVYF